ncbi:MAG: hypothetical protein U5L96_02740 [Owenweeksia sp.]|nr:hypothetical protein [Owenweeksia sp.]
MEALPPGNPPTLRCDVRHSTHQEAKYFPRYASAKVLTIHDLNFLKKYNGAKRQRKLKELQKLVDQYDGFTFISEYTQLHCQRYLQFYDRPQHIIYNGLTVDDSLPPQKPADVGSADFLFQHRHHRCQKEFSRSTGGPVAAATATPFYCRPQGQCLRRKDASQNRGAEPK